MSTNNNLKTSKNLGVSDDLGCSLSCHKPKKLLSAVLQPKPHPHSQPRSNWKSHHPRSNCSPFLFCSFWSSASSHYNLAAAAAAATISSTSASAASSFSPTPQPCSEYNLNSLQYLLELAADCDSKPVKGFGRIDGEGVAVEDSRNPYLDFRHSMLQMIVENEILYKLLGCFLQLNSPCYHGVNAFTEICNGVSSVGSSHPLPQMANNMGTRFHRRLLVRTWITTIKCYVRAVRSFKTHATFRSSTT